MKILAFAISAILSTHLATGTPNLLKTADFHVLAQKSFSLNQRYSNQFVNDVFKDNILLTLAYMDGKISDSSNISWDAVEKPQEYTLNLGSGEVFTFNQDVLPSYQGKVIKTTNAHFNSQDGFKFSGLYYGDGVCHLASLIYWAAKDAGLETQAPVRHDFAPIPQVPREYGTSIYYIPGNTAANAQKNLYVVNSKEKDIQLVFTYDGENLNLQIIQSL
jgi:hypothetical protein